MRYLFQRWLEKLFGLRAGVEDELEKMVRLDTAVAGARCQIDSLREVEEYAQELDKAHPQLAAALRARISELIAAPLPQLAPPARSEDPPTPPTYAAPVKRPPGRPRKPAALPPAPTPPTGGN